MRVALVQPTESCNGVVTCMQHDVTTQKAMQNSLPTHFPEDVSNLKLLRSSISIVTILLFWNLHVIFNPMVSVSNLCTPVLVPSNVSPPLGNMFAAIRDKGVSEHKERVDAGFDGEVRASQAAQFYSSKTTY